MATSEFSDVLGFDLGDGETSLAICSTSGNGEPDALTVVDSRSSFVTAVATDGNGQVLVGDMAVNSRQATNGRITFKRSPQRGSDSAPQFAGSFFGEVLARAMRSGSGADRTLVVVGHPSAWAEDNVAAYVTELRRDTPWQIRGVSESRAAFLQLKEAKRLTTAQLRELTLIVDIGSSTTDFTLVRNLSQQPVEFGHNDLGARLIDRAILDHQIQRSANPDRVLQLFRDKPQRRTQWEYDCRRIKELFFTSDIEASKINEVDQSTFVKLVVDADVVESVLRTSMPELSGSTWPDAYRKTLEGVRDQCHSSGGMPSTIAMTGGASRMQFARDICNQVFSDATVVLDSTPELCIAKGLARAGRWELRSQEFMKELDPLCQQLPAAFEASSQQFLDAVVPDLSQHFVRDVLKQNLLQWRGGRIKTIAEMESRIASAAQNWARGESVKKIIASGTQEWTRQALLGLSPQIRSVCDRYELPYESLEVNMGDAPRSDMSVKVGPSVGDGDLEGLSIAIAGVAGVIAFKVSAVVTPVIVALLMKTALVSSAMAGPIGLLIAGALTVGSFIFGKDKSKAAVKKIDLFIWLRNKIMPDKKIDDVCVSSGADVAKMLRQDLSGKMMGALVEKASEVVKDELKKKMQNALILIGK